MNKVEKKVTPVIESSKEVAPVVAEVKAPKAEVVAPVVENQKKVVAINTFRPAIIFAHNDNNKHALSIKEVTEDCKISKAHFDKWVEEVETLRKVVMAYVTIKHSFKVSATKDAKLAARNLIFPAWKEILENGEPSCFKKELRVDECDVDSIVGYCEQFVASRKGTQIAHETAPIFRKYIESLLGCIIAKNEVLTEEDRDTVGSYLRNVDREISISAAIDELQKKIDNNNKIIKGVKTAEPKFAAYLENINKGYLEGSKDAEGKLVKGIKNLKEDLKEVKESIAKELPLVEAIDKTLNAVK